MEPAKKATQETTKSLPLLTKSHEHILDRLDKDGKQDLEYYSSDRYEPAHTKEEVLSKPVTKYVG